MGAVKWCSTAYPTEEEISSGNLVALMIANTAIALSNILVNIFLVCALKATRQLNSISNKFIACLSISDTGVGLLGQTCYLVSIICKYYGDISCVAELCTQASAFACYHFSGVMLAIISFDRYIHIKHSNKYSSLMTGRRAVVLVTANAVVALAVSSSSVVASFSGTFHIFDFTLSTVDAMVVFFMWCNYVSIYTSTRKRMKSILRQDGPGEQRLSPKIRADAVLAKTILLIITTQIINYFPYFLSSTIWAYMVQKREQKHREFVAVLLMWSILLVCSNSTVNAIIWIYRNPKIKRQYVKRVLPSR